jgi:catechol 2,3-dioxygenase-like lactoylglutathione lyase family enzyme
MTYGYSIAGLYHVGIGVPHMEEAVRWYGAALGMKRISFRESEDTDDVRVLTGDMRLGYETTLVFNPHGGGGIRFIQHIEHPVPSSAGTTLNAPGIVTVRVHCRDLHAAVVRLEQTGAEVLSDAVEDFAGLKSVLCRDPWGTVLQPTEAEHWYGRKSRYGSGRIFGGVSGVTIRVSSMDTAVYTYKDFLGYDYMVYDETRRFDDLALIPGGDRRFRRVHLRQSRPRYGGLSRYTGPARIELIAPPITQESQDSQNPQSSRTHSGSDAGNREKEPREHDRFWGTPGPAHLCFEAYTAEAVIEFLSKRRHVVARYPGHVVTRSKTRYRYGVVTDTDGIVLWFVEPVSLSGLGGLFRIPVPDPVEGALCRFGIAMTGLRNLPG